MDVQPIIDEMIVDFLNDPVRKQGTGQGSSAHSLMTKVLPDGRVIEVQLVITTRTKDHIYLMGGDR